MLFLKRMWNEDDGVLAFEWVMLTTLLTIGIVSGVAAARDAIIDEMGDIAQAMVSVDQSYSIDHPLDFTVHVDAATASSNSGFNDGFAFVDDFRPAGPSQPPSVDGSNSLGPVIAPSQPAIIQKTDVDDDEETLDFELETDVSDANTTDFDLGGTSDNDTTDFDLGSFKTDSGEELGASDNESAEELDEDVRQPVRSAHENEWPPVRSPWPGTRLLLHYGPEPFVQGDRKLRFTSYQAPTRPVRSMTAWELLQMKAKERAAKAKRGSEPREWKTTAVTSKRFHSTPRVALVSQR